MDYKASLKYDGKLFSCLKDKFSKKFPSKFSNDKLYDTWGRKSNFTINFLKFLSKNSTKSSVKQAISILLHFLINKEIQADLKYLTAFNCEIFNNSKKEILIFRNNLCSKFFDLIYLCEFDEIKNDTLLFKIRKAINELLYGCGKTFLGLFELVKYCYSDKADIFIEFISLLNNNDIILKITESKYFDLNQNQKSFLLSNKFNLNDSSSYLEKLKTFVKSNEELC
jgi:hypothetical protein